MRLADTIVPKCTKPAVWLRQPELAVRQVAQGAQGAGAQRWINPMFTHLLGWGLCLVLNSEQSLLLF